MHVWEKKGEYEQFHLTSLLETNQTSGIEGLYTTNDDPQNGSVITMFHSTKLQSAAIGFAVLMCAGGAP